MNEGILEVWLHDDPSNRRELGAGESARVTGTTIEDNVYAWDTLLEKFDGPNHLLSPFLAKGKDRHRGYLKKPANSEA